MAVLSPAPKLQFFDNNGDPLVGGLLYTYAAGTTTPLATFVDYTGLTANTNPVVLNSRGEANVWLSSQKYKFILKSSTGVEIWTVDQIEGPIGLAQLAAPNGSSLIGFVAAGAGAVDRTVQDKLRESVSVADYGAIGDSIADDSSAFAAAFAASNSVFIPDGYLCRVRDVFLSANQELFAEGNGGIYVSAGTIGLIAGSNAVLTEANYLRNIRIHDLRIVGEDTSTGTYGIEVNQAINSYFYNISFTKLDVVIHQVCMGGCQFQNLHNASLSDVESNDPNYVVYGDITKRSFDNSFLDCIIRAQITPFRVGCATIEFNQDGLTFIGNRIFPSNSAVVGENSLYLSGIVWTQINDNTFFVPANDAILIEKVAANVNISDNLFAWAGWVQAGDAIKINVSGSGIYTYGGVNITNNTIVIPSGNGIYVAGIQNISISDNVILSPNGQASLSSFAATAFTKYGIYLSNCTHYKISNNSISTMYNGANNLMLQRRWQWDIYIDSGCFYGTVTHASDYANNSLVYDASGYAKITSTLPVQTNIPNLNNIPSLPITAADNLLPYLEGDGANGMDTYGSQLPTFPLPSPPTGNSYWAEFNLATASVVTDAANPVINRPATNNTVELVYSDPAFTSSATGAYVQITHGGSNRIYNGGQLWVNFWARVTSGGPRVFNWAIVPRNDTNIPPDSSPTSGSEVSGSFILDTTYRKITLCANNITMTTAAPFYGLANYATVSIAPAEVAIFTGGISGNTLTVSAISNGVLEIGTGVVGTGVTAGTTITGFVSGSGGAGTYTVNNTQTVAAGTTMSWTPTVTIRIAGLNSSNTPAPTEIAYKTVASTAIPTYGFWSKGDRVINAAPTSGQPVGWSETINDIGDATSGWKSQGNLS